MNSPADHGFFMPAEWAPHQHTWMLWPERPDNWRQKAAPAQQAFLAVARAIARFEPVHFGVSAVAQPTLADWIKDDHNLHCHVIPTNDAWCRDTGPTVLVHRDGRRLGMDWVFNAWGGNLGGLYARWEEDDQVASAILFQEGIPRHRADFVLEGGAIHVDGEGTLLTTAECLLNPNRNPNLPESEIVSRLQANLGVSSVLWLPEGIFNDETDGHIDNMACFARPGEVVLAWTDDQSDPQYARSAAALAVLEQARDAKGRRIRVHKLPLPRPVLMTPDEAAGVDVAPGSQPRQAGDRLAASYVNFYLCNGGLVMPSFDDPMDEVAAKILGGLFPERTVVQVPGREILLGGGNIHCITQQIPKPL